jgi:uncharacterized membrane protein YraQ (UPF0718 family)
MLQKFADWLSYSLLGLDAQSRLGSAVDFFFYDTTKILILLFLISAIMGVINAYFPVDRLKKYLTTHKLYGLQYFLASLFGAITPFCSCSSIPLFIGFVKGGIPLGVTFAFLITSPLVNEVAVAMFLGTFGVKITLVYVISGILLGMIGGFVLGKMKLEPYLSDWVLNIQKSSDAESAAWEAEKVPFLKRLPTILKDSWGIVKGVLLYVVIGIAIGAAIHGYVPEGFFQHYMSKDTWYAVPLSVILGVPMYANAAGIVPVIEVFVSKGVPIGTALAFMMAVVGLSLPEATMLKKVMKWKLVGIYFGTISLFIIISGYIFNWLL